MTRRPYVSNLTPAWSIARQLELLAANVPGWPIEVYRDELKRTALRTRDAGALTARASLLRPTGRKGREYVDVASIAVMDWRADGFARVLEALAKRGAMLVSHHEGLTFDCTQAADRREAIELFPKARKEGGRVKGRRDGAKASADMRNAVSREAAERVKDRWGSPDWTEKALVKESGRSRNTIVKHLGEWRPARKNWKLRAERAAKKALEERR